jgi:hypothetical protein
MKDSKLDDWLWIIIAIIIIILTIATELKLNN